MPTDEHVRQLSRAQRAVRLDRVFCVVALVACAATTPFVYSVARDTGAWLHRRTITYLVARDIRFWTNPASPRNVALLPTARIHTLSEASPWPTVRVWFNTYGGGNYNWCVGDVHAPGAASILEPDFRGPERIVGIQIFTDCVIGEVHDSISGRTYWFIVSKTADGQSATTRFFDKDQWLAAIDALP